MFVKANARLFLLQIKKRLRDFYRLEQKDQNYLELLMTVKWLSLYAKNAFRVK